MTLAQHIANYNLSCVKYPERINLDGGRCCGSRHNLLRETVGRDVDILFVVKNVPLCEECYEDAYRAAQRQVTAVNDGIRAMEVAA